MLGQPKHLKEQAGGGGFTDRLRIVDGENYHRILYGPLKVQYIYYPTLGINKETGLEETQTRVIKRPPNGCILDAVASLDARLKKARGNKDAKSSLSPRGKWLYKAIDQTEDEVRIQIAEYPFSVYKNLIELEAATHPKKSDKLRHGLIFMYDMIISKKIDNKKSRQYGTSYTVEVDPDNEWSGKIPASALGASGGDLEKLIGGFEQYFTEDEWEVISNDETDLEKEGAPDSPERIEEMLAEYPIFLGAQEQDGSPRFAITDELLEQLDELGIAYLEGAAKPKTNRALPGPSRKSEKSYGEMKAEVEVETEEAEYEEEEEEDDPAPTRRRNKKGGPKKGRKAKPDTEKEEEEEDDTPPPSRKKGKAKPQEEEEEEDDDMPNW